MVFNAQHFKLLRLWPDRETAPDILHMAQGGIYTTNPYKGTGERSLGVHSARLFNVLPIPLRN